MRAQILGAGLVAPSPSSIDPFVLHRPSTLAEAVELYAEHPDVTIVAGCTDLVAQLREGRSPTQVLSVRRLGELKDIRLDGHRLTLGAGLTHAEGAGHPRLLQALKPLAEAWSSIATVRIRYAGTLGGNLMARRTRYELPVLLAPLDAVLNFAASSGSTDSPRPVEWLWDCEDVTGAGILQSVTIDTADLAWFGYERSMRPLTTVALSLRVGPDGLVATATIGSEQHRPVTVSAPAAAPDLAHSLAAGLPDSVTDAAGSADYRRHVAAVLVRRLMTQALSELSEPPVEGDHR